MGTGVQTPPGRVQRTAAARRAGSRNVKDRKAGLKRLSMTPKIIDTRQSAGTKGRFGGCFQGREWRDYTPEAPQDWWTVDGDRAAAPGP